MSFRYCRVYSWPYSQNGMDLSKNYFDKMVSDAGTLVSKLPCNFAIFLAYEDEDSPFAGIALDMDYHAVANSEISQLLDKFKSNLGDPAPSSIENPAWFSSVDPNYKSTLKSNHISVIDGHYYTGKGAPITVSNGPRVIHVEPTDADVQARIAEILGSEDAWFVDPGENAEEDVSQENNEKPSHITKTDTSNAEPPDKTPATGHATPHKKKKKDLKSRLFGWFYIVAGLVLVFIGQKPVFMSIFPGKDSSDKTEAYLATLQLYPNSDEKSLAHGYK